MEDNVGTEGVMSKNHDTFSGRNRDKFVDKIKKNKDKNELSTAAAL